MTFESMVYGRMSNWAPLTALVDDRIYRIRAPQPVIVPFITHERISADEFPAMLSEPDVAPPTDVLNTRIQVDVWAANDDNAREIAMQVVMAFATWIDPAGTPEIFGAEIENDQDAYDAETGLFRTIIDVMISHRRN